MNQFHEKDGNERDADSRMGVSTAKPILEEPYAGKPLVRVCGGAGRQRTALPGKAFVKDFRKLKSKELASAISEAINQVSEVSTFSEINNLKKLSGYKSAFRIRIGDYRIGVIIEKNTVTFVDQFKLLWGIVLLATD